MNILKSLRIGPKIWLGFGTVLALLVVLGAVAFVGLNGASDSFDRYRQLARQANEVGRVQATCFTWSWRRRTTSFTRMPRASPPFASAPATPCPSSTPPWS